VSRRQQHAADHAHVLAENHVLHNQVFELLGTNTELSISLEVRRSLFSAIGSGTSQQWGISKGAVLLIQQLQQHACTA
jgi:hypothetical protein